MLWICDEKVRFHQLALLCLTGSEKTGFADDGRTTDAHVTTVVRTVAQSIDKKVWRFGAGDMVDISCLDPCSGFRET